MNLYGLSAIPRLNMQRKYGAMPDSASAGYLSRQSGGGGNRYPGTYGGYGTGLLPGGRIPISPSNTGQARSLPGVDFPVVGYPETGWSPQSNPYGNMIPGAGGEPQVITTQNIPPNDASRLPITSYYLNPQEFGGGPNAPTYGSPTPYPSPDMNIPTGEDVSPTPINTFYGSTAFNSGTPTRRATGFGAGNYPDLSGMSPVDVQAGNAPAVYDNYPTPGGGTINNPYPNPNYVPDNWAENAASDYGFGGRARGLLSGGINSLLHLFGVQGNTRILGAGGNYPDLSSNAGAVFDAQGYPVPGGVGGLPSTFGGGQSWRSNAARGGNAGGFAGTANATAANSGFGGGLTSQGAGGWQTVSNIPSGIGSMSWQQALGGGFQHYQV